jgi:CDP-6-deoxy-D-xylo-4-hexulose-3-dehydrase
MNLEEIKRKEIHEKVIEFYNLFHKNKTKEKINYAGKIYDEKEMIALTDATLDFWLTSGRFSNEFEKEFAKMMGVRYCLLVNSGSSANLIAISALTSPKLGDRKLNRGDEVITVAAGFPTTIAPIVQNGLIPVFIDIDLGTYNIKIEDIEKAITPKTKAIVLAHTMGNPFNLKEVVRIAKEKNLWLIEDNCDALGSLYDGKLTGTFGDIATSSFYPPHHITMGEGGAVYTDNPQLKMILESFRDWGRDCWCASGCDNTCKKRYGWQLGSLPYGYDHKYTYSHLGYNLKVTDMQAAVGIEQLKKLPNFINARINNFNYLKEGLLDLQDKIILPEATENSQPSWFGFIITIKDGTKYSRNKVVEYLESKNIQTRMLFAGNIIKQPAFESVEYRAIGNLDNSNKIMNDTFLIGVYPGLSLDNLQYMINEIKTAFKE